MRVDTGGVYMCVLTGLFEFYHVEERPPCSTSRHTLEMDRVMKKCGDDVIVDIIDCTTAHTRVINVMLVADLFMSVH